MFSVEFSSNNSKGLLMIKILNINKNLGFWNTVQEFKSKNDILFQLNFNNIPVWMKLPCKYGFKSSQKFVKSDDACTMCSSVSVA